MNRIQVGRALRAAFLGCALLVTPASAWAISHDDLVLYPIDPGSVTPSFDVSDPFQFAMLTLGVDYSYQLSFEGSESGSFQNLPGEILNYQAKLTFHGFPDGFEGGPDDLITLTLLGFFQTGEFTDYLGEVLPGSRVEDAGHIEVVPGVEEPPVEIVEAVVVRRGE